MHGLAEPFKINGFSSGMNGFGGGNVCPAVKSASGAGARERMQWEMGSRVGSTGGGSADRCQDLITTLGEGA
jgi:hypothetical protein